MTELEQLVEQLEQDFTNFKLEKQQIEKHIEQQSAASSSSQYKQPRGMSFMPNPISWVFEKLLAKYKGKLNNGIQEILDNAEIKVTMLEGSVKGRHENTVNINIKIAASLLDEYAGILKFFIDKEDTPTRHKELLHQEHKTITDKLNKLKVTQYKNEVTLYSYHTSEKINQLLQPGCFFGFFNFCYRGRCNKLDKVRDWLQVISQHATHYHQIIGALMLVYNKDDKISNSDDRNFVRTLIEDIFEIESLSRQKATHKPYINEFKQFAAKHEIPALEGFYKPPAKESEKTLLASTCSI